MNKDTEVDMKEVELNELDLEKQPMTGGEPGNSPLGTEKNGCVKVKVPEESDFKFTGLSKEELMKVAGTPGWVRIRWVLLVLFWLGWVGMLAGAIVIIVQAPRCKPLPEMNWWNSGPLYQIQDVDAFVENDGLKGLVEKIESLNQLKVKGLVVGPLHTVQKDVPTMLDFTKFNPDVGTKEDFENLLDKAHKKGLSVVVDMTPNFNGQNLWFGNAEVISTMEKLKRALPLWIDIGVDGFQLAGIDEVLETAPGEWSSLREMIQANRTEGTKKRALIGVTEKTSATEVSTLLNTSGVDLLLSGVLEPNATGTERAKAIQYLYSSQNQTSLAWSVGDSTKKHLATLVGSKLVKLYQLLVFSLPGTPVFSYGDEICLEQQNGTTFPKMVWDLEKGMVGEQQRSCRSFFKTLSDWRGKERSLQHGDFLLLHNSTSSLAFLREWDQSERYLAVLNWGSSPVKFQLNHESLPEQVTVLLSTDPAKHAPEGAVDLKKLELESGQAVLLRFPYSA
uniref:Solute carrier family 3 member 2 n=1 Tax=Scleropages formosus TaxID=113540 RepID=A0A8C9V1U7_SCLFO